MSLTDVFCQPTSISLKKVSVVVDDNDFETVRVAAGHFADDLEMITGVRPGLSSVSKTSHAVIVGTVGKSAIIDQLVSAGKIDVSAIDGKWECYRIEIVKNPVKGVSKALVVAGSDRRGTAYGLFSISKSLGVHPWYWWLDIPVKKNPDPVYAIDAPFTSDEPSVKYRGIFINDEDYGLAPWAKSGIDKESNAIGPRTYEKVCELLLRLNSNLLLPAMHGCTKPFYQVPGNKIVADRYGIVISTSHHEPLNFNTGGWRRDYGKWNFETNAQKIIEVLKARVTEAAPYENVFSIALRGLGDGHMAGSDDIKERLKTLEAAFDAQRKILEETHGKPAETIPQTFTPYKEVLKLYEAGLNIADDVTIVWPDDNYGYMKRVSNPDEQKRSGGSGCYYHVSYHGKPHNFMWINSASAVLMYEELSKVYDTGGDRIWIVNVGDLKGCELGMDQFLAMAYDWDSYNYSNVWRYPVDWLVSVFGEDNRAVISDIMDSYYDLAFTRKPEYMGWGFDYNMERKEICTDTEMSRVNYKEMQRRLDEYERISVEADKLLEKLPAELHTAYFHSVYYPVVGASLMNKVHLLAQTNRDYAAQGRTAAPKVAEDVRMWRDSIDRLTEIYNADKWDKIMSVNQYRKSAFNEMPILHEPVYDDGPSYGIEVEGEGLAGYNILPEFNSLTDKTYGFEIYSRNCKPLDVEIVSAPEWAKLQISDDCYGDKSVDVAVDWSAAAQVGMSKGVIELKINGVNEQVFVSAKKHSNVPEEVKFVEDCGVVSIDAASFTRVKENDDIKHTFLENFGVEGRAVMMGEPMGVPQALVMNSPYLEYDFYCESRGMVDIYTYLLPTFEYYNALPQFEHDVQPEWTRYGVLVDAGQVIHPSFSAPEYTGDWYVNASRNCVIRKTTHYVDKPGKHTVRLICGTPGVVFQKVVIDFGGMKQSYMGPEPTVRK